MVVITLLTDYGTKDSYVAEVKGAILKIAPSAVIVDVTHDVGNFEIEEGAFHLARSVFYFPEGTIHVGVVDPGVGGKRRSLIFKCRGSFLVGPDNGLLAPAAEKLGVQTVYEITNWEMLPVRVSDVFDGRDVFGPVAAHLARGVQPEVLGKRVEGYTILEQYTLKVSNGRAEAMVVHVDGFGNLVTNVTSGALTQMGVKEGDILVVEAGVRSFRLPYVRSFSAVPRGELLALVAGGDFLELSVNMGNAAERLGIKRGEGVTLSLS